MWILMHFVLLEFYAMIVSAHSMHMYTEPVFLCTFIVYIYIIIKTIITMK